MRALILSLAALTATAAHAHRPQYPRHVVVRIESGRLELTIRDVLEDDVGHALLDRFDRDGDGVLGGEEPAAAGALLAERARRSVEVVAAGRPAGLRVGSARVEGFARRDPDAHGVLVIVLEAVLPAADRIDIEAGPAATEPDRAVPWSVEAVEGRLVSASAEEAPGRVTEVLAGAERVRVTWLDSAPASR